MKKLIIIFGLFSILISGCQNNERSPNINEKREVEKYGDETNLEVNTSKITKLKNGWNRYMTKRNWASTTEDWMEYSTIHLPNNLIASINYPNNWILNGTVFNDINDNKLAEFMPDLIKLKSGQRCFDNKPTENVPWKIIVQKDIEIEGMEGVLQIIRRDFLVGDPIKGETWYPHEYCLMKNDMAFAITFYARELITEEIPLYHEIMSTLKIE